MTIYEATKNGPVFVMIGENQRHHIGRKVYKFERSTFFNGRIKSLTQFATGFPHMWIDDQWKRVQGQPILKLWNRKITVVDLN